MIRTEQQRERFLWRVALAFICLSPYLIHSLYLAEISFRWSLFWFIIACFVGLPLPILSEFLLSGKSSKFWIENPSVECDCLIRGDVNRWMEQAKQQLNELGFSIVRIEAEKLIQFEKPKKKAIHQFIDHRFSGLIEIHQDTFGLKATVQLQLIDIVILETGEKEKLSSIAQFIAGVSEKTDDANIPYTLLSAFHLVVILNLLILFKIIGLNISPGMIYSGSLAIAASCLTLFGNLVQNRKKFLSLRLYLATLYLSMVPIVSLFIVWRNSSYNLPFS